MDDVDLDRELHDALAVSPSPEFVARVREKIADAPAPSMLAGWLKPAAALACAVVLAIAIGLPREEAGREPVKAGLKPSTTNIPPSTTQGAVAPTVVVPTLRSAERIVAPATSATAKTAEPPLPEVIIAPDDVEGLQQFVAGARQLRFVASFDETPASTPWVITDLSVSPVSTEPSDLAPAHNN